MYERFACECIPHSAVARRSKSHRWTNSIPLSSDMELFGHRSKSAGGGNSSRDGGCFGACRERRWKAETAVNTRELQPWKAARGSSCAAALKRRLGDGDPEERSPRKGVFRWVPSDKPVSSKRT